MTTERRELGLDRGQEPAPAPAPVLGQRLRHKTALITGSTSNIGQAIAEAFAAEGAHVIVSGRNAERGAEVVAGIRAAGGRADFVAADLDGTAAASRDLADRARATLGGRIDILVNNAGVYPAPATTATDEETFDHVYGVNVKAPFFLTAAVAPTMTEAGGGTIINVGAGQKLASGDGKDATYFRAEITVSSATSMNASASIISERPASQTRTTRRAR